MVVETNALIKGLESKEIIGACMDVFENEKPKSYTAKEKEMYSKLFSYPQVLVTPHVAGWTVESKQRLAEILLTKINKGNLLRS